MPMGFSLGLVVVFEGKRGNASGSVFRQIPSGFNRKPVFLGETAKFSVKPNLRQWKRAVARQRQGLWERARPRVLSGAPRARFIENFHRPAAACFRMGTQARSANSAPTIAFGGRLKCREAS